MAGQVRPKCECGTWYKFCWETETFVKNCNCK